MDWWYMPLIRTDQGSPDLLTPIWLDQSHLHWGVYVRMPAEAHCYLMSLMMSINRENGYESSAGCPNAGLKMMKTYFRMNRENLE